MAFQEYELVILRRRPDAPTLDAQALEENSAAHRAYLTSLRDEGVLVTNGPVAGHPDPAVTAIAVYCTGSVDKARQIAEQDPAVLAGRLTPDVMTWRAPEATLRLPGSPLPA